MAKNDAEVLKKLRPIVPAPTDATRASDPSEDGINGDSAGTFMAYTCLNCAKRKVKCDKLAPACSRCRKGRVECIYQTPAPRSRKRRLDISNESEMLSKISRYESILNQHGLLNADAHDSRKASGDEAISLHWNHPGRSEPGKLLEGEGKTRYISSNIWRNLGDDELQRISDDEEAQDDDEQRGSEGTVGLDEASFADPLTGAFMDIHQNLLLHHPDHERSDVLWSTYVDKVDPLCKILHVPSTAQMIKTVSRTPSKASRADECVVFAVYHFAVYCMSDDECTSKTGVSRDTLRQQYHFAARQALVNASFLRTTELAVLQSLVLLLLSSRFHYDSQTFWVLTGVAVRIGQRIGLHRDGEELGLAPFEIQMRRRLFFQLLPIDGFACQLAGVGGNVIPESWNTEPPLNVNDDQIWPGMSSMPEEQHGATDLMFCLSRICLGKYLAWTGKPSVAGDVPVFKDYDEANQVVNQAEKEVEEKYLRYCDPINPLHFLSMCLVRAGINAMRLRIRLPNFRKETATQEEMRAMFKIAMKTLDTDATLHENPSLQKFRWYITPLSLWGTWDSLIFVLTRLCKGGDDGVLTSESEAAWKRLGNIFENHPAILESKQAFDVALGRLTVRAWNARSDAAERPEPSFIQILRSRQTQRSLMRSKKHNTVSETLSEGPNDVSLSVASTLTANETPSSISDMLDMDANYYLTTDDSDWVLWDFLSQR